MSCAIVFATCVMALQLSSDMLGVARPFLAAVLFMLSFDFHTSVMDVLNGSISLFLPNKKRWTTRGH